MNTIRLRGVFVAALLLLAACGPTATPTPEAAPEAPALGPTTVVETAPTEQATATVLPSSTPLPTSPPTETPTETPSPTPTPTRAPQPIQSVRLEQIASGFVRPTHVTHAFDERLFVVEQIGRILIFTEGQVLPGAFLDISDRVGAVNLEQGLLSVAFHPDYRANGRFFVDYTDRTGTTIVSEFSVSGEDSDRADVASERVLLRVQQPYVNHNGGQLQFGPDGKLYVGLGDGGSAGDPGQNGQNPGTLLGSLLRLDVDGPVPYGIPADNPFVGQAGFRPETWAYGLRNPWRFSFDRLTGDLYLADVGQNAIEEIDFQPAGSPGGQNYGWNRLEGSACYAVQGCDASGTVLPIHEYDHAGVHCSVTGGHVYRGREYPELWGNYFYSDYCSGVLWSLIPTADGAWLSTQLLDSDYRFTSFGEDVNGELYAVEQALGLLLRLAP